MARKTIKLYYELTKDKIHPPEKEALDRKDKWIEQKQKEVEAEWKPKKIRVTYEEVNKEVAKMRKFFNGPVLEYWVIQQADMLDELPTRSQLDRARETLLSEALGYEVELWDRTEKRRRSTSDFIEEQEWYDFLETLRETEFEPNGYEFPDSNKFWDLVKQVGYTKAKEEQISRLQKRVSKKLGLK